MKIRLVRFSPQPARAVRSRPIRLHPSSFRPAVERLEDRTNPAPVVLVDTPEGTYWRQWMDFVVDAIVADDYINAADTRLVRLCTSVDEAIGEIEHFYSNFQSVEIRGSRATMQLGRVPTAEQLVELSALVPSFAKGDGFVVEDDSTLRFNFDGRNYVNLRILIDALNGPAT